MVASVITTPTLGVRALFPPPTVLVVQSSTITTPHIGAVATFPPATCTTVYSAVITTPTIGAVASFPPASVRMDDLRIGGVLNDLTPGISGMQLSSLILKQDSITAADVADFFENPSGYVTKGTYRIQDNGSSDNAVLRFDPSFITDANPGGLVGGPCYFYDGVTWTPIPRDFVLQKGYLQIPPTLAKFFKVEMTNLVAEMYETLMPVSRQVMLFSPGNTDEAAVGAADYQGAVDAGEVVHQGIAQGNSLSYLDALASISPSPDTRRLLPTETLTSVNPVTAKGMEQQSYVYGFQDWHQGLSAPQFVTVSEHSYQIADVPFTNKVAYWCGFSAFQAFRLSFLAQDDADEYIEHFFDGANIAANTWALTPNDLSTGALTPPRTATSKVFGSTHNVRAIQFATQQSPSQQLIPDDHLEDVADLGYTFTDPTRWHYFGDAQLLYVPPTSVSISRTVAIPYFAPPVDVDAPIVWPDVRPQVVSYPLPQAVIDALASTGGIETPAVTISTAGRIYLAVRFTAVTPLTSPFHLQLVDGVDLTTVLVDLPITVPQGQTAETFVAYDIGSLSDNPTLVVARLVQIGKSNDTISVDRLSLFDPGIAWEFSVDGGATFLVANDAIRNHAHGVLTFPVPGNQLVWRAIGMRADRHVTSLKIRPMYAGQISARPSGPMRGPNISTFDYDTTIEDDPEFSGWTLPIPKSWFMLSQH